MQLVSSAGLIPASARSLRPFKLFEPNSVPAALAALAGADDAQLLAGGTDLVAAFNEGLAPGAIVSLARVAALRTIAFTDGSLVIGACVTHHAGSTHAEVLAHAPGFAKAWSRIANPRIRFTATLGGNLMAGRVRYEGSLLLLALGARLRLATAGERLELGPMDLWDERAPARALLTRIVIDTADLAWFGYERSMRPLITLATCLRRQTSGLALTCAVGTEYLRPFVLELQLPHDLTGMAARARDIAVDAFAQLPESFADPVVTFDYAKAAGSVLLARQLAGAAHE